MAAAAVHAKHDLLDFIHVQVAVCYSSPAQPL
jgi:hypothetical protein